HRLKNRQGAIKRGFGPADHNRKRSVDRAAFAAAPRRVEQVTAARLRVARALPALTAETLFYAAREVIRNAARYGRGDTAERALNLWIAVRSTCPVSIVIEDDGIGLHKTKLIEQGSGQGLALHSAMLAVVGGTLAIESRAEGGTRVVLTLPNESQVRETNIDNSTI
ncbi:MAG: ATP-binding protein, partial [Anaerolineales bacterium]|nr:ATP-binding protein [Anaerolineales bacterium]